MHQIKEEDCEVATNLFSRTNSSPQEAQAETMFGDMQLFLGMSVEALESGTSWYPAKIIGINESHRQVLLHFDGFNPRHDKWYDVLGNSIRPLPDEGADAANESPMAPPSPEVENEEDGRAEKQKHRRKRRVKIGFTRKKKSAPKTSSEDAESQQKVKAKKNLSGLSFAIEGTLKIVTEEYITRLIAYNGGECKKNITASIKYVIIGEDPDSSMLRKIGQYGIRIITEGDFLKFAKKLNKPRGRWVRKWSKPVTEQDDGATKQSDSPKRNRRGKVGRSRGGSNDPGESSKESDATSEKTMESSRLRVLAVPLSSTTRADRAQKKGTNSPEAAVSNSLVSSSSTLEFGKVDTSNDTSILGVQNCLAGLQFGNEGKFGSWPLAKIIYKFGGKFVTNISSRVNYLIIGENPRGDRVNKAMSYGINLIDENGLIQLIKEHSENMFTDYTEEQTRKSSSDQAVSNVSDVVEPSSITSSSLQLNKEAGSAFEIEGNSITLPSPAFSPSIRLDSGSHDRSHQRSLFSQHYQGEEESQIIDIDSNNQENQSILSSQEVARARRDHRFSIVVNRGDQTAQNGEVDVDEVNSYRSPIAQNSFVAGNNEAVSLKKGKRGPKKKLIPTDNRVKRARPLNCGSVAAKVARRSNSTSSQPRPRSGSETNQDTEKLSQNEQAFEYLAMNIQCPQMCGAVVDRNQTQSHFENECKNAESECYICGFKMLRKDMDDHISRNIVKHMEILGKELAAGKSFHINSVAENLQLVKKVDALHGKVLSLEKDLRRISELFKRAEKQNKILMQQNERLSKFFSSNSGHESANLSYTMP